jgi:hypothetical protein
MEIKKINFAPSNAQVRRIVAASGMKQKDFEKFFGIPNPAISHHLSGSHQLPEKYWHIFYTPPEKIRKKVEHMEAVRAAARRKLNIHEPKNPDVVFIAPPKNKPAAEKLAGQKHEITEHNREIKKTGIIAELLS